MSLEVMQLALEVLEDSVTPLLSEKHCKKYDQAIDELVKAIKVENALRELTTLHYEMQSKGENNE